MNEVSRRVTAIVGVVALAGGVAITASAGDGGASSLTVLFSAAGGLLGISMVYFLLRVVGASSEIELPDVEQSTELPAPGTDFDRTLAQFDGQGGGYLPDKQRIHTRLQDLATEIIVRQRGSTREEAAATIESGEWPADPAVAAFLRNPNVTLSRGWRDRFQGLVGRSGGASDFQHLVRRTVDALAANSEAADFEPEAAGRIAGDSASGGEHETADAANRSVAAASETRTDGADGGGDEVATGRWRSVVPIALAFVGFGFALEQATVVLAGGAALGFAVYARLNEPPSVSLSVDRVIDAAEPSPGDVVEVTTTIRNDGDRIVPDLRIVDGVPPGLSVTEGSPRRAATLRPGEATSFTYEVTVRRGTHKFGPPSVVLRDYAGTTGRVRRTAPAEGAGDSLTCVPDLGELPIRVPLYERTGQYLGRIPAGGGEGVEFHSTREYRPGDPSTRIDWKQLARSVTNELTTVEFREERAATVALVVDAGRDAYVASEPGDPGAVERSIDVAGRLFGSLLGNGDRAGIAALGPTPLWFSPGAGIDHRARAKEVLAADPAFPPAVPESRSFSPHWVREFHRRFPAETQVVLLSPLCDPRYRFLIRNLEAFGHPVTVISPDATADATVGERLVRLERRVRIEALRGAGVRVVDWDMEEDIAVALGRAAQRWSA